MQLVNKNAPLNQYTLNTITMINHSPFEEHKPTLIKENAIKEIIFKPNLLNIKKVEKERKG